MSLEALKVKIRSLAAESRIIRATERGVLLHSTELRLRQRLELYGIPSRRIEKFLERARSRARSAGSRRASVPSFKVVKEPHSPAKVALCISTPEVSDPVKNAPAYLAEFDSRYGALHRHRTCEMRPYGKGQRDESVRAESRNSLLAYGFLRGVKFKDMERMSYVPPDFDRVFSIAERFSETAPRSRAGAPSGALDNRSLAQRYADWKAEAGEWSHPHAKPAPSNDGAADYKGADAD